jgi:beta-lactamase class A
VLETAEAAIENGSLDPDEMLTMTATTAASDPYFDYLLGTRVSVDCALQTMVQMSGNGAADLLLHRLGAAPINAHIKADGLSNSGITADAAYTSPADIAAVLESIARGQDVNAGASQRMLDLLSGQQQSDRMPAPLPLHVRIAHKTGELPNLRHDAGIVFAPSGGYVLVVLVEDAPTESAARSTIVDVSRAVYDAVEAAGLPNYLGMPPRLAQEALRLPDAEGRLALLGDPRTETASLPSDIRHSSDVDTDLRLRPEVFADLRALQAAAAQNNAPIWVRAAFEQPTDVQAGHALPTGWILPCAIEQPPRTADRRVSGDATGPHQTWLGTVLTVSDRESGDPSHTDDADASAWKWLVQHAPEYGFIPALPEADDGTHLAWSLRWVGRVMARRLAPVDTPDFPARAVAAFAGAENELAADDPRSKQPPLWGLNGACWTIATSSGQGCPSRWYFLGLSLS